MHAFNPIRLPVISPPPRTESTPTTLQELFDSMLTSIPGLQAIVLTDPDGVTLVKSATSILAESPNVAFATTFTMAIENAQKLGVDPKIGQMTSLFENCVVVHTAISPGPLVLTVIGEDDCNTGLVLESVDQLKPFLEPLGKVVETVAS